MIENPPWSDRILKAHWDAIVAASPVPLGDREAFLGRKWEDPAGNGWRKGKRESEAFLGCGHYGCVMATQDPKVVFKLTTDPSEAKFITEATRMNLWPTGIVRYLQILPLPDSHKARPVFAIWRESAREVGQVFSAALKRPRDDYQTRTIYEAEHRLLQWLELGRQARETLKRGCPSVLEAARERRQWAWDMFDWSELDRSRHPVNEIVPKYLRRWKSDQRLAITLRALEVVCEMGGSEPFMTEVFDTLGTYLAEDLLLADVHAGNIGVADREDYTDGVRVITDPGHLVDLRTT